MRFTNIGIVGMRVCIGCGSPRQARRSIISMCVCQGLPHSRRVESARVAVVGHGPEGRGLSRNVVCCMESTYAVSAAGNPPNSRTWWHSPTCVRKGSDSEDVSRLRTGGPASGTPGKTYRRLLPVLHRRMCRAGDCRPFEQVGHHCIGRMVRAGTDETYRATT
jgi:hypothetical protein